MHLVFLTNLYPPYVVGGNEQKCEEIVLALRQRGHRVTVICGRGRELPREGDLYGVLEIDLDRKADTFLGGRVPTPWEAFKLHVFSPRSFRATRRLLRDLGPDRVVVWNLYMASLAPLLAAQWSGIPTVVQLFDKWLYFGLVDLPALLKPVIAWKRWVVGAAPLVLQPLLRSLVRPMRMVAVSAFMGDFYRNAGFRGTIEVVHLGVPTALFPQKERPPRTRDLRLLFVGSLWEGKGPQTAVRALGKLVRGGVPAHLDICGSGAPHFVSFLEGVIREEGMEQHTTLHGAVEPEVVRQSCETHDVLVFASQWDEPFAAVPLEAMSSGMAVVATTAGGTPEAIVDGETGLLVPPNDPEAMAGALRRLAEDPDLARRLGEKAARIARERFDSKTWIDRLEAVYTRPRTA